MATTIATPNSTVNMTTTSTSTVAIIPTIAPDKSEEDVSVVPLPIGGLADTEALEGWRERPVSIGEVDMGGIPLVE